MKIRSTTSQDFEPLKEFLSGIFDLPQDSPLLSRTLLDWKYWEPHPDFEMPRGWVAEEGGRIVAHAGIWPSTLQVGDRKLRGGNLIDWCRAPASPGAASVLRRELMKQLSFVISVGAPAHTQRRVEKEGYQLLGTVWTGVYPCAVPFSPPQSATGFARATARFVRDSWRHRIGYPRLQPEWNWRQIAPDEWGDPSLSLSPDARFVHSPEYVKYLVGCPIRSTECYRICRGDELLAEIIVMSTESLLMLVASRMNDSSTSAWSAVLMVLKQIAIDDGRYRSVTIEESDAARIASARNAGYFWTNTGNVYVWDSETAIPWQGVRFEMLANDGVLLRS